MGSKRARLLTAILARLLSVACLLSVAACTGDARPTTNPGSAAESTTPPDSSARASSDQGTALGATFSWNGGSFRYPAEWRLSRFSVVSSFTLLVAVLSNEQVHDPCTRTPTSVSCGEPLSHLDSGGVLVTWTQFGMAGASIAQQPGTATTVDGRAARVLVTDGAGAGCAGVSGTTAEVDAAVLLDSSDHMWQMRACVAGPNPRPAVETALAMFDSARFDSSVWN